MEKASEANMKMIEMVHKKMCAQVFTATLLAMETIKNPSIRRRPNKVAYLYDRKIFIS